jgi:predicted RNA binding protein YcfA (HicA-like mRNA interferase family)
LFKRVPNIILRQWLLKGYRAAMTRPDKLYRLLVSSASRTINFRDFERQLRAFGFELDRTVGSHRQYVHPAIPRAFPVQPDGKDAKRYQVREFLELVERYGLHLAE